MGTLADRIRWVIDTKKVESARAWCVKAGIAGSYLGTFLHRNRGGGHSDMGVETVMALATSAEVSPPWLAFGLGSPDDDPLSAMPPNLRALVAKRPGAYPEALIRQAAVVVELLGQKDMRVEHWEDYVEALRREARRAGLEAAAARLDDLGMKRG